jgi:hypothetical protein
VKSWRSAERRAKAADPLCIPKPGKLLVTVARRFHTKKRLRSVSGYIRFGMIFPGALSS